MCQVSYSIRQCVISENILSGTLYKVFTDTKPRFTFGKHHMILLVFSFILMLHTPRNFRAPTIKSTAVSPVLTENREFSAGKLYIRHESTYHFNTRQSIPTLVIVNQMFADVNVGNPHFLPLIHIILTQTKQQKQGKPPGNKVRGNPGNKVRCLL